MQHLEKLNSNKKKTKETICRFCGISFLSFPCTRAYTCNDCATIVEVPCACNCGKFVKRRKSESGKPTYKSGHSPRWNKALTKEDPRIAALAAKTSKKIRGIKRSKQQRENLSKAKLGTTHSSNTRLLMRDITNVRCVDGWSSLKICWQRILAEIPGLEKQGWKCIPITNVRPDMIALKDGKIYAVEVEYGIPNYKKYENYKDFKYEDVIWILRK